LIIITEVIRFCEHERDMEIPSTVLVDGKVAEGLWNILQCRTVRGAAPTAKVFDRIWEKGVGYPALLPDSCTDLAVLVRAAADRAVLRPLPARAAGVPIAINHAHISFVVRVELL